MWLFLALCSLGKIYCLRCNRVNKKLAIKHEKYTTIYTSPPQSSPPSPPCPSIYSKSLDHRLRAESSGSERELSVKPPDFSVLFKRSAPAVWGAEAGQVLDDLRWAARPPPQSLLQPTRGRAELRSPVLDGKHGGPPAFRAERGAAWRGVCSPAEAAPSKRSNPGLPTRACAQSSSPENLSSTLKTDFFFFFF